MKKIKKKETKQLRRKRKVNREVKKIIIKRHTVLDDDNILRKIQVRFISFIIYFSNDVISYFLVGEYDTIPYFNDVDYELKRM